MEDLLHKFFVRSSASPESTGYPTYAAAKDALNSLVNDHAKEPQSTREGVDGRWEFETSTAGTLTLWIEDENGSIARPQT